MFLFFPRHTGTGRGRGEKETSGENEPVKRSDEEDRAGLLRELCGF